MNILCFLYPDVFPLAKQWPVLLELAGNVTRQGQNNLDISSKILKFCFSHDHQLNDETYK